MSDVLSDGEINRLYRISEGLGLGLAYGATPGQQAFAQIIVGRDLGLTPGQSVQSLHIVGATEAKNNKPAKPGKIQVAYQMLGTFIRGYGNGYDYEITEHTDETCTVIFKVDDWQRGEPSTFTIRNARDSGLIRDYSPWKTAPKNMLLARAMANLVRFQCPEVLRGLPLLVEGEHVDHGGQLTAGEGDAPAQGIDLGPRVEKVIARAVALGHAGLSDRATIELALGSRSPDVAAGWCRASMAELDAFEQQTEVVDAEPVTDETPEAAS